MPRPRPAEPEITDDTPLRLGSAAAQCFPSDSGITAASLRRESARGRLYVFKIAGKQFTTRAHIRRMIE